jgi:cbb3-type cytochrome oxidase maturation protein
MGLDVLFVLIPASLLLALLALALFVWAIRSGQFDDLVTPAIRILYDDDTEPDDGRAVPPEIQSGQAPRR